MNRRKFLTGLFATATLVTLSPKIPFIGDSPIPDPRNIYGLNLVNEIMEKYYKPFLVKEIEKESVLLKMITARNQNYGLGG